jgi:hypothetical protein
MPVVTVPVTWGSVPQHNKNFTGRDDILARLRRGAEPDPDDPLPQAVQGLGGADKTPIAIEYIYRYRSVYDLVWWVSADQFLRCGPRSTAEALTRARSTGRLPDPVRVCGWIGLWRACRATRGSWSSAARGIDAGPLNAITDELLGGREPSSGNWSRARYAGNAARPPPGPAR